MTNSSSSALISNAAGLRSRKVDLKKPLAIVRFDSFRDPEELAAMTRLQSNVSTGVEKGEEEEHHLQAALVSRHAVTIPTPDASTLADLPNYEKYYTADFKLSKTLIKHSALAEQDMGCPYNLNSDDLEWLESLDREMRSIVTNDDFEFAIYFLDECGNDKVSGECPDWDEVVKVLDTKENIEFKPNMNHDAFKLVYEYWCKARYQRNGGKLLRPILKSEEMSSHPDNDPYVCFRIREIKIHRKVRRSDTLAQDKLRRLKNDMMIVSQLLDLVAQRERARKEVLDLNRLVFEKRMQVRRLKRILGVNTADTLDASPEKSSRKKHRLDGERTSIRIPLQNLREAASIVTDMDTYLADDGRDHATDHRIEEKIMRERAIQEKSGWLDCTEFPFRPSPSTSLWGPHLGIESRNGVHISTRRRMGRGGRIIFDRHVQFNRPSIDSRPQDPEEPSIAIPLQISSLMYRGFTLNQPTKGDGTQLLHNKPSKINNFDPTKIPPIPLPPTEVIRAPPPTNPKKKTSKLSTDKSLEGASAAATCQQQSPSVGVNKKKFDAGIAAKSTEKVKQFLKVAQQQAALQLQKNGGVGVNSTTNPIGPSQATHDINMGVGNASQVNGMNSNQMLQQQRLQQMILMNQQPQGQQQTPLMISPQLLQQQLALMPVHIQQQFASLTSQQQALFLRQLVLGMGAGQQNQTMGMQMQQQHLHPMQMQFQIQQQQVLLQQQYMQQQLLQQQMQATNGSLMTNLGSNMPTNGPNAVFHPQMNQQAQQQMMNMNQQSILNANNNFSINNQLNGTGNNQQPSSIQISSDGKIRMTKHEMGSISTSSLVNLDGVEGGGNPDAALVSNAEVSV